MIGHRRPYINGTKQIRIKAGRHEAVQGSWVGCGKYGTKVASDNS